jgi:SAM-dependent methyltransferase
MKKRTTCPLSGDSAPVIFECPYEGPGFAAMGFSAELTALLRGRAYEVREGRNGFLFQTWVLEDHELPLLYGTGSAAEIRAEIGRQKLHWFAHQTEEILVFRQVCSAPSPAVLDYGSAWGKWASMALAFGCDVSAVEINPHAAEFLRSRGITIMEEDRLPEAGFDFINMDQVLEHLADPRAVFRKLVRALRPGGWIKLSTPDDPELARQMRRGALRQLPSMQALDALVPLIHINLFSSATLGDLAAQENLRPFRLPFWAGVGAGQMWNLPRQLNRNFRTPWKRWRMQGAYRWFRKPTAGE